jgi:hypothetical protein
MRKNLGRRTVVGWISIGAALLVAVLLFAADVIKDLMASLLYEPIRYFFDTYFPRKPWVPVCFLAMTAAVIYVLVSVLRRSVHQKERGRPQNLLGVQRPLEKRYLEWICAHQLHLARHFVQPYVEIEQDQRAESRSISPLSTPYSSALTRIQAKRSHIPLGDLLNGELSKESYGFVLTGELGSGKTTCLNWTTWHQADQLLSDYAPLAQLPVLVEIGNYTGKERFESFFEREVDKKFRFSSFIRSNLASYLSQGRQELGAQSTSITEIHRAVQRQLLHCNSTAKFPLGSIASPRTAP